jgi:hypothetical protein
MFLILRRNKQIRKDDQYRKERGQDHPNDAVFFTKADGHFFFFICFRITRGQSKIAAGKMINLNPMPEWAAPASVLPASTKQNQEPTRIPVSK